MKQTFPPSKKLSHYRIIDRLGAGGMGEVWRARDTRLDREVAVKVLPPEFAKDADRLKRFEQEARATSALNHPNILTVHDIGTHEGSPYIVAELLEGEELRAQLNDGALPVRKVIDYALQIAGGLAAAHEKGIVHRDLKPENIFVTTDGRVKILDFGLAKLAPEPVAGGVQSEAPTMRPRTDPGAVMGTVGYMSPEQVRGQQAGHCSDIFSFGLILYEMLSGRRPFDGASPAETMTAIVKEEAPDLGETNNRVPLQLERIVRRCLEKKPGQRFQSASDLGFALEALSTGSGSRLEPPALPALSEREVKSRRVDRERWIWIAAVALPSITALVLAWADFTRAPDGRGGLMKFFIFPPEGTSLGQLSLSPDGRWLAFTAATGGKDQLWLRPLDALTPQPLAGTDGASFPFWSPDSRFIGFFASSKLKKIAVAGGPVQTLCDAGISAGGAWNRDGVIIFTMLGFGLSRVPSGGGDATLVAPLDRTRLEWTYNSPSFLPDGRHFLYNIRSGRKETQGIYIGSLDSGLKERLFAASSNAVYALSGNGAGYLLFLRDEALLAQPFDARQLKLTGEPIPIAERVGRDPNFPRGNFSVSDNGVLVYDGSINRQSKRHVWVNREGKPLGFIGGVGGWSNPGLSSDEKRVVVDRIDDERDTRDLWLREDVAGGGLSRFTFDVADDVQPVWSPDGSRLVWGSNRKGTYDLYLKASSGAGQDELLLESPLLKVPTGWSLDGRFIVYYQVDPKTKRDVWVLPLDRNDRPFPFLQTEANETGGQFSPDGRWMAYSSDETGDYEVYVQSFPSGGSKQQVSTKGGVGPHWRRDGKELFYYAPDGKLMAVEIKGVASVEAGAPHSLFEFRSGNGLVVVAPYAVTADGQRFLLNTLTDESGRAPLTVVIHWTAAVK